LAKDQERDEYFRKPKKARGRSCESWWYANKGTIEIFFRHADSPVGGSAVLTRRQLADYLKRTEPRARKK
jgi:hypothetical protein